MGTRVLVVYYSRHGHVEALARAVGAGAESVRNVEVLFRRVYDDPAADRDGAADRATIDDLRWADAVAWGTPARYGSMAAALKRFLEEAVDVWRQGDLEDKPTAVFTSSASIHGGQESTILTMLVSLLHFGMIFVGTPYVQNPQLLVADAIGGSPYGPSTLAGNDNQRPVADVDLQTARNVGIRLARVAAALKIVRVTTAREEVHSAAYDSRSP
jgi:NAD(P)H dehydrogenase (quinone)